MRRNKQPGHVLLIILLSLTILAGCSVSRHAKDEEHVADSLLIEYRENIVQVPVTVKVDIPREEKLRETLDSISHLQISFADSWAKIQWRDGVPVLVHAIASKPQTIEKNDSVQVVEKEKTLWRTRRVTITKTEIREKRLAWWQKFLGWSGVAGWLIAAGFLIVKVLKKSFPYSI